MDFKVVITDANRKALAERSPSWILDANDGDVFEIHPPKRNAEQNALFHALCSDISKQKDFNGRKLPLSTWKVLLISGHAVITGKGADVLPGLEGEFVNIRESSASMSSKRISSLIEYTLAWCADNNVKVRQIG